MLIFVHKIKYLLLLLLIWNADVALADCGQEQLQAAYQQLYEANDAHKPLRALVLADSLIHIMQERRETNCALYLWIQYEKGETMELLKNRSLEALEIYYDVARQAKALDHWEVLAETYISIARTHEAIGRAEDCLRNLLVAREIIQAHQLEATFSRFAVRYSSYHRIYDKRDSAKIYARIAVEYGRKHQVERSELDGHLLLGITSEELDSSTYHFQQATNFCLERKDFPGASSQKRNVANRYYNAGYIKESNTHLDTAFSYAAKIEEDFAGYYITYQSLYQLRYLLFEQQGKVDSALHYLKKFVEAERNMNLRVNQNEINQKEMAFAIEREQEKLQHEQQRASYLRAVLVIVGALSTVLVFVLVNNNNKQRFIASQKDLIEEKNVELQHAVQQQSILLSEVHHRVKNNLQLVVSMLTLRGQQESAKEVKVHFKELSDKVYSIALIHDQLYQSGQFEKVNLYEYFKILTQHFRNLDDATEPFLFNLQTEKIELNLATVLPLGMICSELLSNAIKYARIPGQKLIINLSVKQVDNKFELRFQDNGPGYPDASLRHTGTSMGGMLIYSMVRQLQGECTSTNNQGAQFTLSFVEKKISSI